MRRFLVIVALAGLLGGMSVPVAAGADDVVAGDSVRGARVVITADVSLPEPFEGPFTARGAAVRRGIVCPSGDLEGVVSGPGGPFYDFTVRHDFTCADGTGMFSIDLWVRLFDSGRTLFVWSVAGGTDAYVDLSGRGFGFGRPFASDDGIRDRYVGRVAG
ncbi:MAG: hypothetical protein GY720_23335 [bacterium]|nr:hypothetical protein [bacterium]